ncbi:MAG: lipocalin family protein [Lachnospiraceae bacterium]|nr:lipocalin family protein [Lachnospiraceae bacterium]
MRRAILSTLVCVMMLVVLAGCESTKGPSGTYTPGDGLVFITFDGDRSTLHMGQLTAEGTWKLKDGVITITYDNNAGEKSYEYNAEDDTLKASNDEILYKMDQTID